jgi:uncharacterized membrane protein
MVEKNLPYGKIKTLFKTSVIGGIIVILPAALILMIFRWIFNVITGVAAPGQLAFCLSSVA